MMMKIFLISSLILNSFLLIYLFGLMPFLLFMLVLFNILALGYIRFLLDEGTRIQNHFNSLLPKIEIFSTHLSQIYELEMFYGDETLESLINHSKELIQGFYEFEEEYFSEMDEEYEYEDEKEQEIDDTRAPAKEN